MVEDTIKKEIPEGHSGQNKTEHVDKENIPVSSEDNSEKKNTGKMDDHENKMRRFPFGFGKHDHHSHPMKDKHMREECHQFPKRFGQEQNPCSFRNGMNTVPRDPNCLCHQKNDCRDNEGPKDFKAGCFGDKNHKEGPSADEGHHWNHHCDGWNHFTRPHFYAPFFNRPEHYGFPDERNYFAPPFYHGGPGHYEGPNHFGGPGFYGSPKPFMNPWQFGDPGYFGKPNHFEVPGFYGRPNCCAHSRHFHRPCCEGNNCYPDERQNYQMAGNSEIFSDFSPKEFFGSNHHFGRPKHFSPNGPFHNRFGEGHQDNEYFSRGFGRENNPFMHFPRHQGPNFFPLFSKLTKPIEDRPIFKEFDFC
ncbi:uncharacterized protein LOC115210916 [Argonauta hians]